MDTRFGRRIAKLLLQHKKGGLSPAEKAELEQWRHASEANSGLFDRLGDEGYLRSGLQDFAAAADRDDALWNNIAGRVRDLKRRRRMRRLAWTGASAAAVVILGVILFNHRDFSASVEEPVAIHSIVPGSAKAVLYTGDGDGIELSESENRAIGEGITANADALEYDATQPASATVCHTLVIPRGGEHIIKLADGSVVHLNSDSRLRYPVAFGQGARNVELEGEAFFEVAKDAARPFTVTVGGMQLRVTGTRFNIDGHHDGYVETVLVEGGIAIKAVDGQREWQVRPSELAVFSAETRQVEVGEVDVRPYIAWVQGDFVFRNRDMGSIMETLARWYDVDVQFADPAIRGLHFTGDVKRATGIDALLDALTASVGARYRIEGRTVVLYHD